MNPFRVMVALHKGFRKMQAAWRRKHGKAPTVLPWEKGSSMKWIGVVLKWFEGKKVYGIAVIGALTALASLVGHPIPGVPTMTDQEAGALLMGSGVAAAFRSALARLMSLLENKFGKKDEQARDPISVVPITQKAADKR
jgi:hypothetical protein